MTLPTEQQLTDKLTAYVDAKQDSAAFVKDCVRQAVAFILTRCPNVTTTVDDEDVVTNPLGDVVYEREVLELGSELFYRKAARNGVVSTNTQDGNPIRVSADPWRAADARLARHLPLGFS